MVTCRCSHRCSQRVKLLITFQIITISITISLQLFITFQPTITPFTVNHYPTTKSITFISLHIFKSITPTINTTTSLEQISSSTTVYTRAFTTK